MSVQYYNDFESLEIHCDGNDCFEFFEHDNLNIKEASQEARQIGWKINFNKTAADWEHFCPECKNKQ